jgi:hypothetical protein
MKTDEKQAREQARAQFEYIYNGLAELEELETDEAEVVTFDGEAFDDPDELRERLEQNPLSVQVRSGWAAPGEILGADEYELLLCTGGPAVRIIGDLDGGEAATARLEYADWGIGWTDYPLSQSESNALCEYARLFYFA